MFGKSPNATSERLCPFGTSHGHLLRETQLSAGIVKPREGGGKSGPWKFVCFFCFEGSCSVLFKVCSVLQILWISCMLLLLCCALLLYRFLRICCLFMCDSVFLLSLRCLGVLLLLQVFNGFQNGLRMVLDWVDTKPPSPNPVICWSLQTFSMVYTRQPKALEMFKQKFRQDIRMSHSATIKPSAKKHFGRSHLTLSALGGDRWNTNWWA